MAVSKTMKCGGQSYGVCRSTNKHLLFMKMYERLSFSCAILVHVRVVLCMVFITWQKRNNPLFGVFLSSFNREFVKDSHLQTWEGKQRHGLYREKSKTCLYGRHIKDTRQYNWQKSLTRVTKPHERVFYLPQVYKTKLKVEESEIRVENQKVGRTLSRNSQPPCYGRWAQRGL